MNRFIIYSLNLIMLFTTALSAQKTNMPVEQWKVAGVLPAINGQPESKGFAGPVAGVHHNILIVGGGSNFPDSMPWQGGKKKYYDDGYALMRAGDGSLHFFKLFKLPYTIAYAATCSTPKGVIYAGGENEKGISRKVMLMQWDVDLKKPGFKKLPELPLALTNAAVAFKWGKLYLAGGESSDLVSNHLYSLNLNNFRAAWKQLPDVPERVSHTVLAVQSTGNHTYLFLTGGRKKNANGISDLYTSVYRFDVRSEQWEKKKSLPYPLSAGTGIADGAGNILLFGGDKGETFHKTEILIAAINQEQDEAKRIEFNYERIQLQSKHPGFSKEVLQYNTVSDIWSVAGFIPFNVPVTTTAFIWADKVIIPNGEIKAGIRTPQILAGKLTIKETGNK